MRIFRLAITGDFLNEAGAPAYGDNSMSLLGAARFIEYEFIREQAPQADSPDYWQRFYSMEVTADQVGDRDGLIVLRPAVPRQTIAAARELVVIGRSGAGYEKVDVAACTEHDIALFNAPRGLDHATASTALMFMLMLAKRFAEQERITRQGRWDLQADVMGSELKGRSLGIVGLGHSGRELVRLVQPFEMRVLAYSPHADPAEALALGVRLVSLDELLRESDFVSLHARLTAENRRLIGRRELALMKPRAYLVNVARGGLLDQAALAEALREGRLAGAGLDVFEVEPLPPDDPLIGLDNVLLTPHWSASSSDVWAATGKAMAEGMLCAARGQVPHDVINREVLDRPGFQEKLARFAENQAVARGAADG